MGNYEAAESRLTNAFTPAALSTASANANAAIAERFVAALEDDMQRPVNLDALEKLARRLQAAVQQDVENSMSLDEYLQVCYYTSSSLFGVIWHIYCGCWNVHDKILIGYVLPVCMEKCAYIRPSCLLKPPWTH